MVKLKRRKGKITKGIITIEFKKAFSILSSTSTSTYSSSAGSSMNSTKDIIANRNVFSQLSHVWFSYRLGLSCLRNDAGYFRWNSHAGSEEKESSIDA